METITGARAVVKCLERQGIDTVFGYPGGAILPVYDALIGSKIHHVLSRNEQSAAHEANGYARITGKVGVALATSGPGATNLLTGIATAYLDSVPMVAITGQVNLSEIGRDVFQEVDIIGASLPFSKHNYLVKDIHDIPRVIAEAFMIAGTGRPGPVLVDIPRDILMEEARLAFPQNVQIRGYKPTTKGHLRQLQRIETALKTAKKPAIVAGGGCVKAANLAVKLAEKINAPLAVTLMGIGSMESEHPLFAGMLGNHGITLANSVVQDADLLLVLGARMGDRATGSREEFAKGKVFVHIDIDPAEIGKNVPTEIPVVGYIQDTLESLLAFDLPSHDTAWFESLKKLLKEPNIPEDRLTQPLAIRAMYQRYDGVVVTDVGQHQMFAARLCPSKRGMRFLSSGGLGTMGYGIGAAIGGALGREDRTALLVTGDGSLLMNAGELATVSQEKLNIKILLLNNGALGMIRELQSLHFAGRYYENEIHSNTDFCALAKAFGGQSLRIEEPSHLNDAMAWLMQTPGLCLLECVVPHDRTVRGGDM